MVKEPEPAPKKPRIVKALEVQEPGSDPLAILEQQLAKVHTDKVTVSTALLRSLIRTQKMKQNQCRDISGQLEAIKSIDQEAESSDSSKITTGGTKE